VPTNQQRRETERRRLQRQLEERRAREAARRRFRLIASIVSTLILLAAVVVIVIVASSGSGKKKATSAGGAGSAKTSATPSPSASTSAPPAKGHAVVGAKASFQGVTVQHANDTSVEPKVTSKSRTTPKTLLYKDLVVGEGKAASPTSTVTVQYTGVLYKNGKQFDSSWSRGQPAQFPLTQVVPGFTQGIGGNGKVPPMKAGGRRIMILPASLGYGSKASGSIPANSVLVFIVDLKSVDS
jgi:peptidylprolyl isomerase